VADTAKYAATKSKFETQGLVTQRQMMFDDAYNEFAKSGFIDSFGAGIRAMRAGYDLEQTKERVRNMSPDARRKSEIDAQREAIQLSLSHQTLQDGGSVKNLISLQKKDIELQLEQIKLLTKQLGQDEKLTKEDRDLQEQSDKAKQALDELGRLSQQNNSRLNAGLNARFGGT
jgi:ATP-dependent Lon protease